MTTKALDPRAEQHVETSPNGRYIRYNSVLGKGAYKTVYKAFDTEEALEVAWNKLHVDRLSEHDLEKVSNEVSLLRQVEHKNVIHFYDTWRGVDGNNNQTINFITEQMMSGTLKAYLRKAKAIKLKVIRRWCANILEAIAYLHGQTPPIMHRDLKCDNIFINGHVGEVKIGDLGLSGVKEREKADSVIGTPEFMAPELYEESYTEKVDIYAFGMCLLEMVSMEYPYSECNNMAQIFKKVFNGEKPHALGMLVDGAVKDVIAACLQREARRPSAVELLRHPLFSEWEKDEGVASNLSLVKGIHDTATVSLEATPSSNGMPIGTEVIDWSDPLQRSVLVTMIEGDNGHGDEQQQFSVVATKENGGFYIGLEIPIRDAIKRVEFTFDPFEDNSTHIAQEMVAEFQLGAEQLNIIREEIDKRVRAAKSQRAQASRNATPQPTSRPPEMEPSPAAEATSSVGPTPVISPPPESPVQTPGQPGYSLEQPESMHGSQGLQGSGLSQMTSSSNSQIDTAPSIMTGNTDGLQPRSSLPVPHTSGGHARGTEVSSDPGREALAHADPGPSAHAAALSALHSTPLSVGHEELSSAVHDEAPGGTHNELAVSARNEAGTPMPPTSANQTQSVPSEQVRAPPVTAQAPPAPIQAPPTPVQASSVPVEAPSVPIQTPSAPLQVPSVQVQASGVPAQAPPALVQPTALLPANATSSAPIQAGHAPAPEVQPAPPQPAPVVSAPPVPAVDSRAALESGGNQTRSSSGSLRSNQSPSDVNSSEPQDQHKPKSPVEPQGGQLGLPQTSSFVSSHTHSATPVDTPSGVLSPGAGQEVPGAVPVLSQTRHQDESTPGVGPAVHDPPAPTGIEVRNVSRPGSQRFENASDSGVQTLNTSPTRPPFEVRDVGVLKSVNHEPGYPSAGDAVPAQSQLYSVELPQKAMAGGRMQREEHDPLDFRNFPHSASDGQLPPASNIATVDIPPRPPSTPIMPAVGFELADEHHLSSPSAAVSMKSLEQEAMNRQAHTTRSSDIQGFNKGSPDSATSSHSRAGPSSRPAGSVPQIVVVGAPSQSTSHDASRHYGNSFSAQSLPSFPSSEGFFNSRYTSPPPKVAVTHMPSSRTSTSHVDQNVAIVSVQSGDIGRGSPASSPRKSPPQKLPANRTNSWKSMQSDDSGNNIAPRIPAGKVIGEEHDQKYYTMCLTLMDYCARGRIDDVIKKLDDGANPNFADYDQRTPLHLAAAEGHLRICALLIEHGANVERKDRWANTPLAEAIDNGHSDVQTLLKSHGASDEKRTCVDNVNMELMRVAAQGDVEAVRSRIVAGADVTYADYDRRTPLHLACTEGHPEVAELLLVNGASPEAIDRKGRSPVDDAVKNGHRSILRVLRQYGANIPRHLFEAQPELENQKGMDLIEHAARGRVDAVKKAIDQGANANFADYDRRTALHLACVEGRLDVVRVLLETGAVVNVRDRWGATPADEAKKGGFSNIADELLLWERKRKQRQAPAVSFDHAAMVLNGHDRSSLQLSEPESTHLDHLTHGIASSVSLGAIPNMNLSADDFAAKYPSAGVMLSEKASSSSLPLTPFDRSDDFARSSSLENEQRLLQQAYDAEKQKLDEQHRRALEGLQRKKSAESRSSRNSAEGTTPVISIVNTSQGETSDDLSFSAGNGRAYGDSISEAAASGSFGSLANGAEIPRVDSKPQGISAVTRSSVGSSTTSPVQVLRPPRYQPRERVRNEDLARTDVSADIRSLVDNLIDLASTRR